MKSSLRILNLEDDLNDASLNERMLSARWPDCTLERVDTEVAFVEALKVGAYDVILSDYSIPGFDGRAALKLARQYQPKIPFLFVSGTIGEDTAIEALKNGATDYVLKNHPVRLIPAVDRALREAREHQERERAEHAMRQSEHKYRELFESLSDAAFLADERAGKIIDTNRQAEALLGCPRTEILGKNQSHFLALDHVQALPNPKEPERYSTIAFACEMTRADGRKMWVEVRSTRLTLYDHPLVLRLCHEIGAPGTV